MAKAKKATTKATKATTTGEAAGAAVKALTKAQVITTVAEASGLARKEVARVLDALGPVLAAQLKLVGEFKLINMIKVKAVKKEAVPAGPRKDPFSGVVRDFPAKPARTVVKATPLKALKDAVG